MESVLMVFSRRIAFTVLVAVFAAVCLVSCAGTGKRAKAPVDTIKFVRELKGKDMPHFDIPIDINDRVIAWIEYFQGVGRRHFERYLARSGRYMPLMRQILKEEGVPQDLVYISMIESGFNPQAYSRAHAVGLWQFIRSTGRLYGLEVGDWEDDRRDPYKSTRAAAKFFKDLYDEHGDWYLAMVGYNAGPGRIRKAVNVTGSKDFWEMADHNRALRAETRDYVPKFIAAALIAKMPDKFGFNNIVYEKPLEFDETKVESQTDLEVIADCAGTDLDTIAILNSQLYKGVTPAGSYNYTIRVPKGSAERFKERYAKLPKEDRIRIVQYRTRKGDTVERIARKFGVSAGALASANNLGASRKIRRGTLLTIPKGGSAPPVVASAGSEQGGKSGSTTRKYIVHTVRSGENASTIASKYGVKVADLKRWNSLDKHAHVKVGQRLEIYKKVASQVMADGSVGSAADVASRMYVVKQGETLGEIAERNGVSTLDLMSWNDIADAKDLKAGKTIFVRDKDTPRDTSEAKREVIARSGTTGVDLAKLDNGSREKREGITPPRGANADVYKVKKGDTFGSIAKGYGVSISELMAQNNISDPKKLKAGMKLSIPGKGVSEESHDVVVASASAAEHVEAPVKKTPSAGQTSEYRVKKGDSLGSIARSHGVSVKDLMAWNKISNPKGLRVGQRLKIKNKGSAPSKPAATKPVSASTEGTDTAPAEKSQASSPPPGTPIKLSAVNDVTRADRDTIYHVKEGDTLWGIARKHNVTIAKLQQWNNLKDPSSVKPGTTLTIKKD
jgi:membrane-bound lytic murein transglycosylase D